MIVTATMKIPSRARDFGSVMIARTKAAAPITNMMLATFEPMTLPIEIPTAPSCKASRLVTSSGRLVPKPTRVRPITNSDIPALRATPTEPRTNASPPAKSRRNPPRISMVNIIGICSKSLGADMCTLAKMSIRVNDFGPIE